MIIDDTRIGYFTIDFVTDGVIVVYDTVVGYFSICFIGDDEIVFDDCIVCNKLLTRMNGSKYVYLILNNAVVLDSSMVFNCVTIDNDAI